MGYETELKLFIDGAWRQGEGDLSPVINPATGDTIAELSLASTANLEEALAAAERAWPEWRALEVEKRAVLVRKTAPLLRARPATPEGALPAAGRAWPEWRALEVEKRAVILHKTASLLRERAEEI